MHPGGDCVLPNGAGYKPWAGVSWQGHTKAEFTEWAQENGDVNQLTFVFNRKSEVLNSRMANAIFLLSNGFVAVVHPTVAAGAPAGRAQTSQRRHR